MGEYVEFECDCKDNPLCNSDIGHVISGDIQVLKEYDIMKYFERGTKFRKQNFVRVREQFLKEIDAFIYRMAVSYSVPYGTFDKWRNEIMKCFDGYYKPQYFNEGTDGKFDLIRIRNFQAKYVIAYMDKVVSNFAFTCKKYYKNQLESHYSNK